MPSNAIDQGKVLKIARHEVAAFKVAIVGRDSLTSGLLAMRLSIISSAMPPRRGTLTSCECSE